MNDLQLADRNINNGLKVRLNNPMLCKHLDEFTGICCNADSEYIADVCPYCDVVNETLICNREAADCFEEEKE